MADIIERYLDAIASHDWDVVDECIADDIVRVGPYRDRFSGRHDYMAFIADLMPKLQGYAMDLDRVTYVSDARAYAPEVLVFELNSDGRIARVDVFIQTPEG
jgi:ketosteroid isomerase-like protein